MRKFGKFFLVGPMGAGKTTIGKMLAEELRLPFKDADREIEARSGVDIPWIFDAEGEDGFRRREAAMIQELSELDSAVISTGGGAVLLPENRTLMAARGVVIYLHTTVEEQVRRTAKDRKRPLLANDNPEDTLRQLMEIRHPLYEEIADIQITTDTRGPKTVVQSLCRQIMGEE